MKIALTGATGFIGKHLESRLGKQGHSIISLGRSELKESAKRVSESLAGCDVLINLAGAPISRRWTEAYKQEMVSSRVDITRLLVDAMKLLDQPPATFISTSAIGAFDTGGRYTESDIPNATDFLGELSRDWEAAALEAESMGIRTLIFRFGLVLGTDGGLMKQLLLPFRLGLGGPVGDGRQHFSWVHIDDLTKAYVHALGHTGMSGVFHICAPNPTTNLEFTRILGSNLRRPTLFPVPKLVLKLIYGEGAEVMTSGQCVISERLPEYGFEFDYPDLGSAVSELILAG